MGGSSKAADVTGVAELICRRSLGFGYYLNRGGAIIYSRQSFGSKLRIVSLRQRHNKVVSLKLTFE